MSVWGEPERWVGADKYPLEGVREARLATGRGVFQSDTQSGPEGHSAKH